MLGLCLRAAGTYRDDAFDLVSCPISTTPLHLAAYVGNFDAAMEILKSCEPHTCFTYSCLGSCRDLLINRQQSCSQLCPACKC